MAHIIRQLLDRRTQGRILLRSTLVVVGILLWACAHASADPDECRTIRIADAGYSDNVAQNGLLEAALSMRGYSNETQQLALPLILAGLKAGKLDVFLDAWTPSMDALVRPFLNSNSVVRLAINLDNAKFTLAVPSYTYDAGLRSFEDIFRFDKQLGGRIYGIESGNDGNGLILGMLQHNQFQLGRFQLVESSEQAMLEAVSRAIARKEPIVFLAWDPHPMNQRFSIRYLAGGDSVFGPNFGHAEAYTLVAPGYVGRCANVGRLLKQLKFSTSMESEVMDEIHSRGLDPVVAARLWLDRHPEVPSAWLNGVVSVKGASAARPRSRSGLAATYDRIADRLDGANEWIVNHKIPVGTWFGSGVHFATRHAQDLFDELSHGLTWVIGTLTAVLLDIPPLVLIGILALGTFMLHRTVALPIFTALSLLLILNLGYWEATTQTLLLILFATFISVMIGVPLGVCTAHRPWLYNIVRPLLDLMQTIPTFVYLIPTLILFGLGVVPGLISTVIFAVPAPIRLTCVGIDAVPKHMKEVGLAFGATPLQILLKVELPYAMPWIREGITQCIMLSLSMVVIAALVGAGGLGVPVVRALNSVQVGMGFEAGFAIVLLAIVLDRVSRPKERSK